MAMELIPISQAIKGTYQPNARIASTEAQDEKPIWLHLNCVSTQRILGEGQLHGVIIWTSTFIASVDNLENMSVKVDCRQLRLEQ